MLLIIAAELKVYSRPVNCSLVPHRVKVQEGLVVLPLRGHSFDGLGVFVLCQVEVREGGNDRGT